MGNDDVFFITSKLWWNGEDLLPWETDLLKLSSTQKEILYNKVLTCIEQWDYKWALEIAITIEWINKNIILLLENKIKNI